MSEWAQYPGRWAEEAICSQIDPEVFFPEKGQTQTAAKHMCRQCPVQVQCLTFALDNGETHGIWGGTTHNERRYMGYRHREEYIAPEAPPNEDWHGTPWGIKRHQRLGTEICRDCRLARRSYSRSQRQKRDNA